MYTLYIVYWQRLHQTIADWGEKRHCACGFHCWFGWVLLYVHRDRRLIRDGSPGRPPRLSHSSWAVFQCHNTAVCCSTLYVGSDCIRTSQTEAENVPARAFTGFTVTTRLCVVVPSMLVQTASEHRRLRLKMSLRVRSRVSLSQHGCACVHVVPCLLVEIASDRGWKCHWMCNIYSGPRESLCMTHRQACLAKRITER